MTINVLINAAAEHDTIQINEFSIQLRRSRRRTLALEISPHGIIARAPNRMPRAQIVLFIQKKQHWLRRKLIQQPTPQQPIQLKNGAQLPFLGEQLTLIIDPKNKHVYQLDNQLFTPNNKSDLLKRKLTTWYKQRLLELLEVKIDHYAAHLNVQANNLKIREYKRRWGSCDAKANLSFNWRIIMAPEAVIDYVVVHELSHIIEFNHSKRFWAIVSDVMPQWKEKKEWLNNNGASLYQL